GRTAENCGYQRGGGVADRDCFDPLFFNIAPREAEPMRPHQRLILQESWAALEDAGYNPKSLDGQAVSVYIGAEPNTYAQESFTGASDAIIASRLAYFLNLTGAAMVVNTGCSSSAVAIHLAAVSLRSGEATMALAGGVFATLDQGMLMELADIDMLSPTGRCHTFDASADGTAFSEGVGVVVLKRLNDAIADGDPIYGVLVASGINQDGASNGMTAPNGLAQQALISDVYRRYRINPEQISYVEAHGTGTRLGDPVEANALVKAFGSLTPKSHYCAIGSTKAHIGHTSASAGVIGLIRILLSLQHRQIPGLPHFRQLNPLIEFSGSAFYVNTETLVWHSPSGQPLMAALNSFGHSGTNAHLVVSEYIGAAAETTTTPTGVYLIVLSAKNADRLQAYTAKLLRFVQAPQQAISLSELAYTLQTGREAMPERLAFTVTSLPELAEKLEVFLNHQHEGLYCGQAPRHNGLLALLGADAGLGNTLGNWFALGQYDKLLELWVQGVELDWTRLYGSAQPRRMSLPTYPFAREHYWAGSASTPHTCAAKTSMPPPADESLAYLLRWQVQPPAPYCYPVPLPQTMVLVYPPCAWGLEQNLSEAFKLHHPETLVVKVLLAEQSQQLSAHEWQCAVADGQSLAACLQGYSHIDSVYFLATPDNQVLAADSVVQSQQYYEWSLLRLIQVLKAKIPSHAMVDCYLVTLDNYAISGNAVQPLGAGVTGLAYALAQSDPRFAVRNLDVSSSDLADSRSRLALVNSIWQEAASGRGEVVKLNAGGRYKQRFYSWELPAITASAFKTGGVYLLLGGSGSVGRVITRYLLEQYQAKVVWLGRTPVGDLALQQKLAQFSRWQGALSYSQADANDLASLQQAITGIKQQYPLINGAIFSGLVFRHERALADTVDAEFGDMLAVKTVGSVNFYQALQGEALDFMCYFSSIQAFSFLSAKDSAAYAAGIVFADTFVQSLQATARFPVGSINWGYWADTTVGTDLASRLSKHFGLIGDAEGCQFFEQFIHHLRHGVLSQALCLRAKASVRDLMASAKEETMTLCKQEAPSLIQSLCQEGYVHYDPVSP
ncbi:MAG: beta-ketoacyl synthase N-terminal-like domain-containing protein, partial [Methylovulum sp.]|nr:beta-ketoacyl synthase N-terminal-like domain-containing protein [Methylovulum sp.]